MRLAKRSKRTEGEMKPNPKTYSSAGVYGAWPPARHKVKRGFSDTERLDWLLKGDPHGRNRRFIDDCLKAERFERNRRETN
jgi:hypothetical protein